MEKRNLKSDIIKCNKLTILEQEECYRKLLQKFPDDLKVLLNLADNLYEQGENVEVKKTFEKMIELKPDDVEVLLLGGNIERDMYNYEVSNKLFKKVNQPKNHYNKEAWQEMAYNYVKLDNYNKARDCIDEVEKIDPTDEDVFFDRECIRKRELLGRI